MTKLRCDEEFSLTILSKICKTLHADFGDVVEYVPDAEIWDLYNENRELLGKDHIRGEQLPIDGYLIRAAMHAFYKDPEKWVTGSYIKIGYFGKSDSDLVYQDEVYRPLIEQVDKTVDLVYTKYMKALIMREFRELSSLCSTRTHFVRFC